MKKNIFYLGRSIAVLVLCSIHFLYAGPAKKADPKTTKTPAATTPVTPPPAPTVVAPTGPAPIMLQPPVVRVVQGNIVSATFNGADVTADLQSLMAYHVNLDLKKYPGANKDLLTDVFEGDPMQGQKNVLNYTLIFADGTRKDAAQGEGKSLTSPSFTQPMQVLEARYGGMSGKQKIATYTDVTRYLQDNIQGFVNAGSIKNVNDPTKVKSLTALFQGVQKKQVQVTLNGATAPADLTQAWPVKVTVRAPVASALGSLQQQPAWVAQNWSNKVPTKTLGHPGITITAANNGQFRSKEVAAYQKLPAALQQVINENKTADPNIKLDKKGNPILPAK